MNTTSKLGTAQVTWDLSVLYAGIDDPQLDQDVSKVVAKAASFNQRYKNNLSTDLGAALRDLAAIEMLTTKIGIWLHLKKSLDVSDSRVAGKEAEIDLEVQPALAENLSFFEIELGQLTEAQIATQASADAFVSDHLPYIRQQRVFTPHLLSEEVESALGKRSMFGPEAWTTFFGETEANLRFTFENQSLGLEEIVNIISNNPDAGQRAAAMKTLNDGLGERFVNLASFSLFQIAGKKTLEDRERKYPHALAKRNLMNMVPDQTVEALHQATTQVGGPLAQRYYRLKAQILALPRIRWSDRNAPLPFADHEIVPFDAAMEIVQTAYRSFSPTLAELIATFIKDRRIDAHVTPNRGTGAFNHSGVFPGSVPMSFTFLNYLGSRRDIMTVAHELGHAVHGILAGRAQGVLQAHPPIAYCETASIFGEMTTFNHVLAQTQGFEAKMSLLCSKIEDMLNSTVRQISFSNFERRIHGDGQRRSPAAMSEIWMEETRRCYGADGDVFTYEHMEHLWSYVSHFHRPFYVYGYAFGELLTQSLYAKQAEFGDRFEPLYLELLKAGATKNAVELMQPFHLNPTDPEFWAAGIRVSLESMIEEAEHLWQETKGSSAYSTEASKR